MWKLLNQSSIIKLEISGFFNFYKKFLNHIVEIEFLDYCYYLNKRFLNSKFEYCIKVLVPICFVPLQNWLRHHNNFLLIQSHKGSTGVHQYLKYKVMIGEVRNKELLHEDLKNHPRLLELKDLCPYNIYRL